jgi:hypothetical protein
MRESILFREVPLKHSEKAALFKQKFGGRVFRVDTDNPVGLAADSGWTGFVQLRFVMKDHEMRLIVRES